MPRAIGKGVLADFGYTVGKSNKKIALVWGGDRLYRIPEKEIGEELIDAPPPDQKVAEAIHAALEKEKQAATGSVLPSTKSRVVAAVRFFALLKHLPLKVSLSPFCTEGA